MIRSMTLLAISPLAMLPQAVSMPGLERPRRLYG
jgi:hypothetical protein